MQRRLPFAIPAGLLLAPPFASARPAQDVQAPRGQEMQTPRDQDVQAPHAGGSKGAGSDGIQAP
jgi:hypothetical protein